MLAFDDDVRSTRLALTPVRTTAPTGKLLTLDEVKQHLRVDGPDEDDLIQRLIDEATELLDGWNGLLGSCLLTQTWRQDLSRFPNGDRIQLPLEPVSAITYVKYYDTANVQQTLATSVYSGPFHDELGPFISLQFGQTWPVCYTRPDAVSITFAAGYANTAAVPEPIRKAARMVIADAYENRETAVVGVVATRIPTSIDFEALRSTVRSFWF